MHLAITPAFIPHPDSLLAVKLDISDMGRGDNMQIFAMFYRFRNARAELIRRRLCDER